MLKLVANGVNKVNSFLEKRMESSFQFITPFAWMGIIGFPLYFFLYFKTEKLWLDVFCMLVSIVILLTQYSIIIKRQYLPICWFLFLLIIFPFNFTYNVFLHPDLIYQLAEMLMLMGLVIIVSNLLILCILLLSGIALAMIVYQCPLRQVIILMDLADTGPIYLLGLVFAIIIMRKRASTEILCTSLKNKLEGMVSLAHCMAHELSTPLVVIKLGANNLKKFYPELIAGYQLAKQEKLEVPPIPTDLFPLMQQTIEAIESDAEAASSITQMLLMNVQNDTSLYENFEEISMYDCIEQALDRYPYRSTFDRKRIHWDKSRDFKFKGNELLMVHVFLNLMKNAIRAILKVGKGEIEIYNDAYANNNYVYFKDTGSGIKKEEVARLFSSFYSTHKEGTGLGLYFCKNTLENFDGDIYCESEEGEYTTSILQVPKCY